ncbi:hypothetical protein PF010_g22698 [Phytophthora fragariae]|uniref:Uncharacterized protein n=1 Tax=Phytophthora fragariae TaxID=53985 RepID=A0A6G0K7M3_9STRA|nr:hypothetical protein PF010_g22698 [Phytophthora fragariae]
MSIPRPVQNIDEKVYVISFDGSAKAKRDGGAFGAIIWKLPGWTVEKAASGYDVDLTGNEAEYRGLLLALDLLKGLDVQREIVCGDSNLANWQLRDEMDCKALGLQLLRKKCRDQLKTLPKVELFHVRQDWNASADLIAGQALQRQAGMRIVEEQTLADLVTLNRLGELLDPMSDEFTNGKKAQDLPVRTRSGTWQEAEQSVVEEIPPVESPSRHSTPEVLDEMVVKRIRMKRIREAQDEESWIHNLKKFIRGDVTDMTSRDANNCSKLAHQYEEDENGLLFYHSRGDESAEDRSAVMKLVIPETLKDDILHHYHSSLEGVHQGIGRTYHRVRQHFQWPGLYKSVQRYVGECIDCETGKGRPAIRGESPGNIVPTYPFQVIAIDLIPSLPPSFKDNTELLIWVDLFTGFVVAKAKSSRTAQTVAEAYEECVFRRFGASEAIRHDREPGFMSDFVRAFYQLVGQRQRATLAYRPQANGSAERMVQTITRAIKMYVEDEHQRDWDEYAERLTYSLNTAYDRMRKETPFFLVHGWDPRSTIEASLSVGNTQRQDVQPRQWRFHIQKHYLHARAQAADLLKDAIAERAEAHNETVTENAIEVGTQVWLFLDRVKPGYAKKLAHQWHGPFRVQEMVSSYAVKLEVAGTPYHLYPVVHISKLKLVRQFPTRPAIDLRVPPEDRLDFDEDMLPEDSWAPEALGADVFEVEAILDVRSGRRTRYGRTLKEYLVRWKGYVETTWVDEADLNCGGLIYDFNRRRTRESRFEAMQSSEPTSAE